MTQKPRILITNDDGISAPGIKHLWAALHDFADLSIVAPAQEQSGVGAGLTLRNPLHVDRVEWEKGTPAWKVSGTPADCIRMGFSILNAKPDLIVSGINRGSNSGRTVLYSGTVGGVIDGILRGVPGVAFSCSDFENPDFALTEEHVLQIVKYILEFPLPKGTLLNVNFPKTDTIKGVRLARQGMGYWIESPEERVHPEGNSYYWLGGIWKDHEEHEESDVALLNEGFATAVPIHVGEMTDHAIFKDRKDDFAHFFDNRARS
ncbi:MAG: 5'/3'-nucleotidase SurE [Rhabdochlamydiaceae bacterium]|nr:5'/3'-nucleotidase SurE [Rhabdochlamydiaceae bacterium]